MIARLPLPSKGAVALGRLSQIEMSRTRTKSKDRAQIDLGAIGRRIRELRGFRHDAGPVCAPHRRPAKVPLWRWNMVKKSQVQLYCWLLAKSSGSQWIGY